MAILGYNVHDTGWDQTGFDVGRMYVTKFTQSTAAVMTELHAWVFPGSGSAGTFRLVIYADNGSGFPGARVAYTNVLSTGTSGDIEVSQTGFSVSLAAGDYWLGFNSITVPSSGLAGMYAGAGGIYKGILSGASNPPPDPFGTPNTSGSSRMHTVWAVVGAGATTPVADFTGTPTSGTASLSVAFTDGSTNTPTSWAWTFGDGGTSSSQNPTHSYTTSGIYTVALVATNSAGSNTKTRTAYITVGETISYAAGGGIFIY